jgi:DNA-binding NarL/FixJ family response regulator
VLSRVLAWARGEVPVPLGAEKLTRRELEVLQLLARGWDNRRIAEELEISEGTAKNHVTSIYTRLGVCSRAEAVAWAWERGVIEGG